MKIIVNMTKCVRDVVGNQFV